MGFWIGPFYITKAQEYADELAMDGSISMQGSSRSTVYRWIREINEYYKCNGYDFKAVAVTPKKSGLRYYCIELAALQ